METKSWYQSKTIWGIGVAVGCALANWAGVELAPQEAVNALTGLDGESAKTVLDVATRTGTILGGVLAIAGRLATTKTIGSGGATETAKQE